MSESGVMVLVIVLVTAATAIAVTVRISIRNRSTQVVQKGNVVGGDQAGGNINKR